MKLKSYLIVVLAVEAFTFAVLATTPKVIQPLACGNNCTMTISASPYPGALWVDAKTIPISNVHFYNVPPCKSKLYHLKRYGVFACVVEKPKSK